jgi:uncharacterized protein YndB with AHSA1/START domain
MTSETSESWSPHSPQSRRSRTWRSRSDRTPDPSEQARFKTPHVRQTIGVLRVGIRAAPSEVFRALTEAQQLEAWWATEASGEFAPNERLKLGFGQIATLSFLIREFRSDSSIVLACVSGPDPWQGSTLGFELEEAGSQVYVTLIHSHSDAEDDSFLYFNTKWPLYLLSLRDFLEFGRGRPYPTDIKVYHGD